MNTLAQDIPYLTRARQAFESHMHGDLVSAEAGFKEVLARYPDNVELMGRLGHVYNDAGRHDLALPLLTEAVRLLPNEAMLNNNLGAALQGLGRNAESLVYFAKTTELDPAFAGGHGNLGNVLYRLQRVSESEPAFRRALELNPNDPEARLGLAMSLLLAGRWEEGWKHYLERFAIARIAATDAKSAGKPWRGESLKGKSILVFREQGFGDEIMLVRYAEVLRDMGAAKITWVCSEALRPVFSKIKAITSVVVDTPGKPLPPHDYTSAALNLPAYCGTTPETVPSPKAYLQAEYGRLKHWRQYFFDEGLRVGLVWKGDRKHLNDGKRSLPSLAALAPLWRVPGVRFYSLQKGSIGEVLDPRQPIRTIGLHLNDFSDTAAAISHLDLVICVDTAVAHLAGALGKPVWVMTPFELIDWRWMLGREDTPWYPGVMRLFRQGEHDDWAAVIERVTLALEERVAK